MAGKASFSGFGSYCSTLYVGVRPFVPAAPLAPPDRIAPESVYAGRRHFVNKRLSEFGR
jgi:hypothetical protein